MRVHVCMCTRTHIRRVSSPAVSEEALGLGARAVLAVVAKMMVPEGTTSVVSVEHVQTNDIRCTQLQYLTSTLIPLGFPCTVQVRE